jgi:hypothetical protein
MISIEQAVDAARDFAARLYAEGELRQLRVEEIETTDDDTKWLVTLGWVEPAVRTLGGIAGIANTSIEPLPRVYKVFAIHAQTGKVESMKMRD